MKKMFKQNIEKKTLPWIENLRKKMKIYILMWNIKKSQR